MTAKKLLAEALKAMPLLVAGAGAVTGLVGAGLILTSRLVDGLAVGVLGLLLCTSGVLLARLGGLARQMRRHVGASQSLTVTAPRFEDDLVAALAAMKIDAAAHRDRLDRQLKALAQDQRSASSTSDEVVRQTAALVDLHMLLAPEHLTGLPGGFAAEPATIHELVRHILNSPTVPLIVECGSGSSTLWLALACRRRGNGRVVALEHDPHFAEETRALLADHQLDQFAEVRTAPLAPHPTVDSPSPWYSVEALSDLDGVDLLFVDGPPGHVGKLSRYPALPAFASKMSAGAVIALDDAERPSEQATLEKWHSEIGLEDLGLKGRTHYLRLSEKGQVSGQPIGRPSP